MKHARGACFRNFRTRVRAGSDDGKEQAPGEGSPRMTGRGHVGKWFGDPALPIRNLHHWQDRRSHPTE